MSTYAKDPTHMINLRRYTRIIKVKSMSELNYIVIFKSMLNFPYNRNDISEAYYAQLH